MAQSFKSYGPRNISKEDKMFNQTHSGVPCVVERVLGLLKQHCEMVKARYLNLGQNRIRVELMCVAHNSKQGLSVRQGQYA
jgi:hypothetical protein